MEKPRIRAAFHSCLWFRAAVPAQQQRGPPFSRRATAPQEPKRFPYPYKKTARSISTGSGRFLLFSVRQRGSRSPALLSPLFPSTLRQAQQTKELLPYSLPASRKPWEREDGDMGETAGVLPSSPERFPLPSPTFSILQSPAWCRGGSRRSWRRRYRFPARRRF